MTDETEIPAERGPMSRWNKIVLGSIVSILVLSMGARAMLMANEPEPAAQSAPTSALAPSGLVAGVPGQGEAKSASEAAEPDASQSSFETALPYVTEGSFFALIGFALGYASKKIVKLMLIFLAIFFVAIQALSYGEVLTVDWSRAVDLVNHLILNLNENETIGEVLKDKLPTAGALGAGYWLGFRKG